MKNIQLERIILLKLGLIRHGVGVFVEEKGVRMAEVRRTVSGFVLSRAHFEPFPEGMDDESLLRQREMVSETIAKCAKQIGVKPSEKVYSSPSATKTVTRFFQIPYVSLKERSEAIRFEGARFVPFNLDETVFGYHVSELKDKNVLEVVFNAIRIDVLRDHVRAVEGGRLKVFETEPVFYAFIRALQAKINTEGAALAVNFSTTGDVSLSLIQNHMLYVCRDFLVSITDPQASLDKFFIELRSSLDYFRRLTETAQVSQVLISGDADLSMWKKNLDSYFEGKVPVEIATFPTAKGFDPERSSAFLAPVGLALRALDVASSVGEVSLLSSGAVAEERFAPRKWTSIAILGILLIGVLFYFAYFIPQAGRLRQQLRRAVQEVGSLEIQLPTLAGQSAGDLERKLQDIQAKTNLIQTFQSSQSLLGKKFSILSETMPGSIWLSNLDYGESTSSGGLAIANRRLLLQGYIYFRDIPEEELKRINEYADALQKLPDFMAGFTTFRVDGVERIAYQGRHFTRFRITCTKD